MLLLLTKAKKDHMDSFFWPWSWTLEVIQVFLIQLHIKPTKVLTKNNYLSQKFFWKNVSPFGNKNSKFQKTVIKKSPQYDRILKISMRGWQALSVWLFTIFTFFAPAIYWSIFQDVMDQKMTGAKKVTLTKNQFFHACQPRGGIFQIGSYCGLSFMIEVWTFDQLFPIGETFFQKIFWLKSLFLVSTLVGLMWSWIKKPWMTSIEYVRPSQFWHFRVP